VEGVAPEVPEPPPQAVRAVTTKVSIARNPVDITYLILNHQRRAPSERAALPDQPTTVA
jgi:hypothetical protein